MNTFYHVGREGEEGDEESDEGKKRKMEKEFRIGATGAADSCGMSLSSPCNMSPPLVITD